MKLNLNTDTETQIENQEKVDWKQLARQAKEAADDKARQELEQQQIKLWLDKKELYNRADRRKMGLRNYSFTNNQKYDKRRTMAGIRYEIQKQMIAQLFAEQSKKNAEIEEQAKLAEQNAKSESVD